MKFLPYERFVIKTHLDPSTVLSKIDSITEKPIWLSWVYTGEGKPYLGKLTDNRFELNRHIRFRYSFRPVIKGRVNLDINGSIIMVTMRLNICVIIFLVIGVGSIIYGFIPGLMEIIQSGTFENINPLGFTAPLGLLLFLYLMTMIFFKYEAINSRAFLKDLLQAHQVIELGLLETEMNT